MRYFQQLERRRTWRRRADGLTAAALPFGGFFGAGLLSVAITPSRDYAAPMVLLATYAGAVALVLLAGAAIAAIKAA